MTTVPRPLPQIDFGRIRQHDGSQHRAWEELGYVLVPDIERLPRQTRLERRATPDAGIEFSCPAPDGRGSGRWAWQAKYLFRLDDSAFAQMTRSVNEAVASTPDLTRYVFMLPKDRSVRRPGRGSSSMQKWTDHVDRWKATAAASGLTVDFDYIGHSDMLAALQLAHHAGAARYFFDETLFTPEFFRQQVNRETVNLGQRYDPEVHVDLDIGKIIDAVCRSPRFTHRIVDSVQEVERRHGAVQRLAANEHVAAHTAVAAAVAAGESAAATVSVQLSAVRGRLGEPDPHVLGELRTVVTACADAARDTAEAINRAVAELPRPTPPSTRPRSRRRTITTSAEDEARDPIKVKRRALYDALDKAWALRHAAEAALHQLDAPEAKAADVAAVLLQGPAGCGKSHLVADAASTRVDNDMPTLLILGQHLETGSAWPQIADAIDVDLTGEELLAALQVAAQISGGGRALFAIDAINEGAGAQLWHDRLAGFLADIARYPWVAVVLTIRDTYTATVLPDTLPADSPVRITHPGLAGHEEEALARYAEHFGLRLPDVPPLLPELLNPLFLRSMCRSVQSRGLSAIPREATSLTWVFDGLLDAVNMRLADPSRLDVDPADNLIRRTADDLAAAMLDTDSEALPTQTAKDVCERLHADRRRSKSLFEALVAEGVLLRETTVRPDRPGGPADQIRFTYQRLADHLRADALVTRHPADNDLRDAVLALATGDNAWARTGMIEALVLSVPERRGHELADLVQVTPTARDRLPRQHRRRLSEAGAARSFLHDVLGRMFFDTLPWRAAASIQPATLELLRRYLNAGAIQEYEWLTLLLSLACVPDHPLNVRKLDTALRRMTMPERDEYWSDQVLAIWSEDSNPIARTIDWAWSATTNPPDDVSRLAVTLLTWLCTSPNRRLRDTASKALVRLVDNRTRLIVGLIDEFAGVDDAYVTERLLAAACGHALRHRHTAAAFLDDFAALGQRAFDLVFAGPYPPAHLLIRHYARTLVQVVDVTLRAHGSNLYRATTAAAPPYQSPWPLTAPPLRDLARAYGLGNTRYLTTATVIGYDFALYTIERGIGTEFILPNQQRRQQARRATARRRVSSLAAQLLDTTPASSRASVANALDVLTADPANVASARAATAVLTGDVPTSAKPVLDDLVRAVHKLGDDKPVRPDANLLGRWIAARVLDLGWTKSRFGDRDRMLNRARQARWSETERFGKKYIWIAFHELLGHLADHCLLQNDWSDAVEPYQGPWQLDQAIDLDPSVVLRGDEPPKDTPAARLRSLRNSRERAHAWWLRDYEHTISPNHHDDTWLHNTRDIPRPENLVHVVDPAGDAWIVLESHVTWGLPAEHPGPVSTDRRQLWIRTQANLIQRADETAISTWAADQNWMGLWMPTPSEHSTGFLGAYPDIDPWPTQLAASDAERRRFDEATSADPPGWQRVSAHGAPDVALTLASGNYRSPSNRDFSAVDLPQALLPSKHILDLLRAKWSNTDTVAARELGLGPVETEYSWVADGRIVAFASAGRRFGDARMLCVRANTLHDRLTEADLTLWSWVLGEKIYWTDNEPSAPRAEIFSAVGLGQRQPAVWGLTVEHRAWHGHNEHRTRLLTERATPAKL